MGKIKAALMTPFHPRSSHLSRPEFAARVAPVAATIMLPKPISTGCCQRGTGAKYASLKGEGKGEMLPRAHQSKCTKLAERHRTNRIRNSRGIKSIKPSSPEHPIRSLFRANDAGNIESASLG